MARTKIPLDIEANVVAACRRKCCICFALNDDRNVKRGQIAHLDRNPSNNDPENLAFLCLDHHDEYDGRTSQSKGLKLLEVKRYRQLLHEHLAQPQPMTMLQRFHELLAIREDENRQLRAELEQQSRIVQQLQDAIDRSERDGAEMRMKVASDPSTAAAETQKLITDIRAYRILLVEPHEQSREILGRILERYGHEVRLARSYSEAFGAIQRGSYDMMISELNLGRDGPLGGNPFELAKYARNRDIICIALTGYGTDEDRRQSAAAGFAVHLTKPVDIEQLQSALAHAK